MNKSFRGDCRKAKRVGKTKFNFDNYGTNEFSQAKIVCFDISRSGPDITVTTLAYFWWIYHKKWFFKLGILSLLGIGGVVLASFMGDKTKPYDETFKKLALASFGAIALGGLLTFFTKGSAGGRGMFAISANVGFGVWLAIIVGLAGLGWITGIIKLPPPNPPPPPPKP